MPDRVGQQFGEYRLKKKLGEGSFAEVYLAENIHIKNVVALKILKEVLSPEDKAFFEDEGRTVAQWNHPHIIQFLHFGVQDDIPYIVMKYAEHGSLRDRYPTGSVVELATVISYVREIADALQYAHDQKIVHRDVKPANFLLGSRKEVLLSDFGIATTSYTFLHKLQNQGGTLYYMAPEQFDGRAQSASDQYSLAITAYEWLCGTVPFKGLPSSIEYQHKNVSPPPLRDYIAVAPTVEVVILKALAKDPNQRHSTVKEFADKLEQAYKSEIARLINASEFTVEDLRQEYAQDLLFNQIAEKPDWWKNSGQVKIANLRKQAEKEARTDIANVLSTLAEKAVGRVEAAIEQRNKWEGVDNLLHLIEEVAPPSINPNVWVLLLKNLSAKQQVREAVLGQWKIHSELLAQWGRVSSSIDDTLICLWFPTEWSDLWRFLALPLLEKWHDIAVENLLSTKPLSPSLVQSIEREHHSLVKNYLGRSLRSTYGQDIAVRLFAKLVGSGYAKKMDLLYTLLSLGISQKDRRDFAEKILTQAHLTKKEIMGLLESYGSRFESYYRLPIVASYAEQYLIGFGPNDLDRTSARQLIQFMSSSSSIPLSPESRALAQSWQAIITFIDQPTTSRVKLGALAPALSFLSEISPNTPLRLLSKLAQAFVTCVEDEIDLIAVIHALSPVLVSNTLQLFYTIAESIERVFRTQRSETLFIPYIRFALELEKVYDISTIEQERFAQKFLDMLLRNADHGAFEKLNTLIIAQNWPAKVLAKWCDYASKHNRKSEVASLGPSEKVHGGITAINPPAVKTAEESSTFPLAVKLSATVLLVRNVNLQAATVMTLNAALKKDKAYNGSYVVFNDPKQPLPIAPVMLKGDEKALSLSFKPTVKIVPNITQEQVQHLLAGKSKTEVQSTLMALNPPKTVYVQGVSVEIWPPSSIGYPF